MKAISHGISCSATTCVNSKNGYHKQYWDKQRRSIKVVLRVGSGRPKLPCRWHDKIREQRNIPNTGYSTAVAIGTPAALKTNAKNRLSFPNSKYDDQVDPTVFALAWMTANPQWTGCTDEALEGSERFTISLYWQSQFWALARR